MKDQNKSTANRNRRKFVAYTFTPQPQLPLPDQSDNVARTLPKLDVASRNLNST